MDEDKKGSRQNTVLVIDDSDVDRQTMCELLADAGYVVHDLPTAIGATRTARERGARAVVIDQNLPGLDGSKLATLFRSNPSLQHVCVVLISSNDATTMANLVRESRADAFVSKAGMHTELVTTLRRLLS
jgi:CheY-like chemotaxis protein